MRQKIKVKKEADFTKSLGLNDLIVLKLDKCTKNYLNKNLDLSDIIEKTWNDKRYTDKELIWVIFNLGMARARKDATDNVLSALGSLDLSKMLGGLSEK